MQSRWARGKKIVTPNKYNEMIFINKYVPTVCIAIIQYHEKSKHKIQTGHIAQHAIQTITFFVVQ